MGEIRNTNIPQTHQDFTPKYYRIKHILIKDIQEGKYPPNTKIPSVTEIMKQYNVSRLTATRVINELSGEGITYAIRGKGCFVSGLNNTTKEMNHSKRVVFILPIRSDNEYYVEVLMGVLETVQSENYRLEILCSEYDYNKETQLLSKCLEEPIAGLIFIPSFYEGDYKHIFELQKKGIPIVLIDRCLKKYDLNLVGIDCIKTAKNAVKYLIKMGHKSIVFLGAGKHNSTVLEEIEGYKKALKEKNIKIDPDLILDTFQGMPELRKDLKDFILKKKKFTAIYAYNDDIAVEAYKTLKEKGLKVPEDVSVIGFDDRDVARNNEVPLTTIRQDIRGLGRATARTLFELINNRLENKSALPNNSTPVKKFLKTKLIIRKSVRKIENLSKSRKYRQK